MLLTFLMYLFIMLIANILMILCIILYKKSLYEREKSSPFECGFDQKSSSRSPFSLRFFLITIIFLIFDVEITLILPTIFNLNFSYPNSWFLLNMIFIFILFFGLIHEWNQGALEWSK